MIRAVRWLRQLLAELKGFLVDLLGKEGAELAGGGVRDGVTLLLFLVGLEVFIKV